MAHPESLPVVGQDSDGRASPVDEDKHRSAQGIPFESVTANAAKPIDSGSEIDRFNGQKDAHLRSNLDHDRLQNALAKSIR